MHIVAISHYCLNFLFKKKSLTRYRPVSLVVKDIGIGAVGLEFDYQASQIGHSVAKGSLFTCIFILLSRNSSQSAMTSSLRNCCSSLRNYSESNPSHKAAEADALTVRLSEL